MADFHHEPLPSPRSIRLISLDMTANSSLRLNSFHLGGLPVYKALSYTWDTAIIEDPDDDSCQDGGELHRIEVNGKAFGVRRNLYD